MADLSFPDFGVPFPYQNLLQQLAASMQQPPQGTYGRWGGTTSLGQVGQPGQPGLQPGQPGQQPVGSPNNMNLPATGFPQFPATAPGMPQPRGDPVGPGGMGLLGLPTAPNSGISPAGYSGPSGGMQPGQPGGMGASLDPQNKSATVGMQGASIMPTSSAASGMTQQEQMARAMLSRSNNQMGLYQALGQSMAARGMSQDQIAAALNSFGGTAGANGGAQQQQFRQQYGTNFGNGFAGTPFAQYFQNAQQRPVTGGSFSLPGLLG